MTTDLLALGRDALRRQAFSQLLGARLDRFEPGLALLRMPLRPDLLQQHGFVHGGALSYLADNALTFAGGSVLGNSVTAEYKINYLRPARGEGDLVAEARVVASGKTQAVCRCEISLVLADGQQQLCAAAQGTIRKMD